MTGMIRAAVEWLYDTENKLDNAKAWVAIIAILCWTAVMITLIIVVGSVIGDG